MTSAVSLHSQQRFIPQRHADVAPHTPGDSVFLEAQPAPRLNNVRGGLNVSGESHPSSIDPSRTFMPPGLPWMTAAGMGTGEKWPTPTFMPPPPPPFGAPFPPLGYFQFPASPPPPPPPPFPLHGTGSVHQWDPHSQSFSQWAPPQHFPAASGHYSPYMGVPADPSMPWLGPAVPPQAVASHDLRATAAPQQRFEDPYRSTSTEGDGETRRQTSASALEQAKIRSLVQHAKEHFGLSGATSSRSTSTASGADGIATHHKRSNSAAERGANGRVSNGAVFFGGPSLREQRMERINQRRQSAVEEWKQHQKAKPKQHQPTSAAAAPRVVPRRVASRDTRPQNPTREDLVRPSHHSPQQHQNVSFQSRASARGVTVKALKGYAPDLAAVMKNGLPSEQQRLRDYERIKQAESHTHNSSSNNNNVALRTTPQRRGDKFIPGIGSPTYEPFIKAAQGDHRAAMYLEGIEDLYKKLRQSYDEFQRNPEHFLKAPAAAAIKKAVASDTLDLVHEASNVRSVHVPLNVEFPATAPPSSETVKLREELDRLEIQWQRLSDVRSGATPAKQAASGASSGGEGFASPISTKQGVLDRVSSMPRRLPTDHAAAAVSGSFSPDSVLEFVREKKQSSQR